MATQHSIIEKGFIQHGFHARNGAMFSRHLPSPPPRVHLPSPDLSSPSLSPSPSPSFRLDPAQLQAQLQEALQTCLHKNDFHERTLSPPYTLPTLLSSVSDSVSDSDGTRKRKLIVKIPYPTYQVKRSKKEPKQQCAIDWLKMSAKQHFETKYDRILGKWGAKHGHWGTCILSTADWQALDPLELASIFNYANCPPAKSDRLLYTFGDHSTALSRAVAWFADAHWPHRAGELDVFLGAGPFEAMDGSHLCHQSTCIVHLVYESAFLNLSRKACHELAQHLRRQGEAVPIHCSDPDHDPPCMMQHAALTTYEAYLIQFSILRKAKGLPPIAEPPRPRRHTYNTFEYQLPVLFCGNQSSFDTEDLNPSQPIEEDLKPELVCQLCTKIKAFTSIVAAWSHIVHKHAGGEPEHLTREISRITIKWKEYWARHPNGSGPRNAKTLAMMAEVDGPHFSWDTVLAWNLK
ncbi:hypothetical protein VTL71DRAFT_841 [Oculimacula yallundae]|uniref:Zinc-binding loop region of homing endonuclease domain-containing protein n=1 Tax=Oculimacula yallundae TaxID=86028 RepID=A0ABR4D177_9HELO